MCCHPRRLDPQTSQPPGSTPLSVQCDYKTGFQRGEPQPAFLAPYGNPAPETPFPLAGKRRVKPFEAFPFRMSSPGTAGNPGWTDARNSRRAPGCKMCADSARTGVQGRGDHIDRGVKARPPPPLSKPTYKRWPFPFRPVPGRPMVSWTRLRTTRSARDTGRSKKALAGSVAGVTARRSDGGSVHGSRQAAFQA